MLVDDHAVVRAGYRRLPSQSDDIEVIREADRGEEACQYYAGSAPATRKAASWPSASATSWSMSRGLWKLAPRATSPRAVHRKP
jgi:hypothetical protein